MANKELEPDAVAVESSTESGNLSQDHADDSTNLDLEPGEIRDDGVPPSIAASPKPISRLATQFTAFPVDAMYVGILWS